MCLLLNLLKAAIINRVPESIVEQSLGPEIESGSSTSVPGPCFK